MSYENLGLTGSIGVTGKLFGNVQVGASLSAMSDRSVFDQALDTFAGADSVALLAATGGLPDILLRQTTLKVFAKYAMDKRSSVRGDFVHQQSATNDWTWGYNGVPFVYSDGTTLSQKPTQKVGFLGFTYTYVWQ
jgi:hypothetical protein